MNARYIFQVIAIILAIILPGLAQAEQFGEADKGHNFAVKTCSSCHAVDDKTTISPNLQAPSFKAVADLPSTTRTALTVWLRSLHPTMPELILSAEEKDNVIAYILSLKDRP